MLRTDVGRRLRYRRRVLLQSRDLSAYHRFDQRCLRGNLFGRRGALRWVALLFWGALYPRGLWRLRRRRRVVHLSSVAARALTAVAPPAWPAQPVSRQVSPAP